MRGYPVENAPTGTGSAKQSAQLVGCIRHSSGEGKSFRLSSFTRPDTDRLCTYRFGIVGPNAAKGRPRQTCWHPVSAVEPTSKCQRGVFFRGTMAFE